MNVPKNYVAPLATVLALSQQGCEKPPEPLTPAPITNISESVKESCKLGAAPSSEWVKKSNMPFERPAGHTTWWVSPGFPEKYINQDFKTGKSVFLLMCDRDKPECEQVAVWWMDRNIGKFVARRVVIDQMQWINDQYAKQGILTTVEKGKDTYCFLWEPSGTPEKEPYKEVFRGNGFAECTGISKHSIGAWMNKQCIQ